MDSLFNNPAAWADDEEETAGRCATLMSRVQKEIFNECMYTLAARDIVRVTEGEDLATYAKYDQRARVRWYQLVHDKITNHFAQFSAEGYVPPKMWSTFDPTEDRRHYDAVKSPSHFDDFTDSIGEYFADVDADFSDDEVDEVDDFLEENDADLIKKLERHEQGLKDLKAAVKNRQKQRVIFDGSSRTASSGRTLNMELDPPKRPHISFADLENLTAAALRRRNTEDFERRSASPEQSHANHTATSGRSRDREPVSAYRRRTSSSGRSTPTGGRSHSASPHRLDPKRVVKTEVKTEPTSSLAAGEKVDVLHQIMLDKAAESKRFDELEKQGLTCQAKGGGGKIFTGDSFKQGAEDNDPKSLFHYLNLMDKRQKDAQFRDDPPKFGGNKRQYTSWFKLFKLTIDDNSTIPEHCKITKLLKCLTGPAYQLALTVPHDDNRYKEILHKLQDTYGRPEIILDDVLYDLKRFPQVQNNDLTSLTKYHTLVRELVHHLQMYAPEMFQAPHIILGMIRSKLPGELLDLWNRYWPSHKLTIPEEHRIKAELPRLSRFLEEQLQVVRTRLEMNRSLNKTSPTSHKSNRFNSSRRTSRPSRRQFNAATMEDQAAATISTPGGGRGRGERRGRSQSRRGGGAGGGGRGRGGQSSSRGGGRGGGPKRGRGGGGVSAPTLGRARSANPAPSRDSKNGKAQRGGANGSKPRAKCMFCGTMEHSSRNCNASNPGKQQRADMIVAKACCYNCLSSKHKANECPSTATCTIGNPPCGRKHVSHMHGYRAQNGKAVKVEKKK